MSSLILRALRRLQLWTALAICVTAAAGCGTTLTQQLAGPSPCQKKIWFTCGVPAGGLDTWNACVIEKGLALECPAETKDTLYNHSKHYRSIASWEAYRNHAFRRQFQNRTGFRIVPRRN